MQLIASIHAYDVMDEVHWNLVVLEYDDYEKDKHNERMRLSGRLPGTGDDQAEPWLAALLDDICHTL